MTTIWDSGNQIFSTGPPPTYDFNQYAGTLWTDNTNKQQWFGGETSWEAIDSAQGLSVQREDILIKGAGSVKETVFDTQPPTSAVIVDGLSVWPNPELTNNLSIVEGVASISSPAFNNIIMYDTSLPSPCYCEFKINDARSGTYLFGIVDRFGIDGVLNRTNWMTDTFSTFNFGLTAKFDASTVTISYNGQTDTRQYTSVPAGGLPDACQVGINNVTGEMEFILFKQDTGAILRTLKLSYAYGQPFGSLDNKRFAASIADTNTTVEAVTSPLPWLGSMLGLTYFASGGSNPLNSRVSQLEDEVATLESYLSQTVNSSAHPGEKVASAINSLLGALSQLQDKVTTVEATANGAIANAQTLSEYGIKLDNHEYNIMDHTQQIYNLLASIQNNGSNSSTSYLNVQYSAPLSSPGGVAVAAESPANLLSLVTVETDGDGGITFNDSTKKIEFTGDKKILITCNLGCVNNYTDFDLIQMIGYLNGTIFQRSRTRNAAGQSHGTMCIHKVIVGSAGTNEIEIKVDTSNTPLTNSLRLQYFNITALEQL